MTAYEDFLRAKVRLAEPKGFEVEPSAFNPCSSRTSAPSPPGWCAKAARPVSRPSAWASR
ncbi:hypothetical protein [Pseudomonas aeruginosa]|uniref:hypothetical protein n=1 Tax=Pseudomonas aeruginosa TaxID=287 RepID=UPI00211A80ED|nr:hypothetical protein [Pseudomonas aeruginosa]